MKHGCQQSMKTLKAGGQHHQSHRDLSLGHGCQLLEVPACSHAAQRTSRLLISQNRHWHPKLPGSLLCTLIARGWHQQQLRLCVLHVKLEFILQIGGYISKRLSSVTLDLCWLHAIETTAHRAMHAGLCHLQSLHRFSKHLQLAFSSPEELSSEQQCC